MKNNKKIIIVVLILGIVILISHFVFHDTLGLSKFHPEKKHDGASVAQEVEEIAPNTIEIKKYAYTPGKITIKKGTTITWINRDVAPHTVTIDDESKTGPKSKFFGKGEKFTYTFDEVGIFPYHCEPHPYMKAAVEVTE